jgi:hypothetical protein
MEAGDTEGLMLGLENIEKFRAQLSVILDTLKSDIGATVNVGWHAVPDGDGYQVNVAPATTSGWTPGKYTWVAYVARPGERFTVESGEVEILPDPAVSGSPLDLRSQARKALDDLKAARATWVSTGGRVKRYSIAGRDIEYKDAAEIDMEIAYWTKQVGEEQTGADLEAGRRPKNRILTRFVRAS